MVIHKIRYFMHTSKSFACLSIVLLHSTLFLAIYQWLLLFGSGVVFSHEVLFIHSSCPWISKLWILNQITLGLLFLKSTRFGDFISCISLTQRLIFQAKIILIWVINYICVLLLCLFNWNRWSVLCHYYIFLTLIQYLIIITLISCLFALVVIIIRHIDWSFFIL